MLGEAWVGVKLLPHDSGSILGKANPTIERSFSFIPVDKFIIGSNL